MMFRINLPYSIFLLLLFGMNSAIAQENTITAGVQFKPVFSSEYFNTGKEEATYDSVNFAITPGSGFCVGMIIRKGFTNTLSFETGINYVKRNYRLNVTDSVTDERTDFKIIGYEIPIQGLIFIQLSDQIYMDVAMGVSLDFFPSDIQTVETNYKHYSARTNWISTSVIANIGWEYRTEKSGYFYLGASFHRPFNYIYRSTFFSINDPSDRPNTAIDLNGNYLTLDLRYFFHSDPAKRKKKTKK